MEIIKEDLIKDLNKIQQKLDINQNLTEEELQTLLLSSLWSEESNERK